MLQCFKSLRFHASQFPIFKYYTFFFLGLSGVDKNFRQGQECRHFLVHEIDVVALWRPVCRRTKPLIARQYGTTRTSVFGSSCQQAAAQPASSTSTSMSWGIDSKKKRTKPEPRTRDTKKNNDDRRQRTELLTLPGVFQPRGPAWTKRRDTSSQFERGTLDELDRLPSVTLTSKARAVARF
uniref:Secreted protein n=1 Tax=Panagrellus redivivus TaxID=6233 RepID=A0A7E4VEB7_PANRE